MPLGTSEISPPTSQRSGPAQSSCVHAGTLHASVDYVTQTDLPGRTLSDALAEIFLVPNHG